MDRETLKAVERELHEQLAKLRKEYKGQPKQYGLGCCDGFAMAIKPIEQMLEQLRDAAPRGEEPPIELTDDMIHQMLGEAEAAYNRARSDAGGSGEGHRVQHEFGKFAKAETVRSYLFQAGILPAPVGRQTPTDPPQTSRSELMRHAVQRGGRPMDVAALPAPVGGQTPLQSNHAGHKFSQSECIYCGCSEAAFLAAQVCKQQPSQFIPASQQVGGQTPIEPPADAPKEAK